MKILFSCRAGIRIFGGGAGLNADWPLGKITLCEEAIILDLLFKSYVLSFSEIDSLREGWLTVSIEHHVAGLPRLVKVYGWRLSSRLRETIRLRRLPVRLIA